MKAMIFAAGLGTRLKPLTDRMPKALVEVAGKPLLQHQLEKLRKAGATDIVINVHHFADMIEEWVAAHPAEGLNIRFSDERQQLLETGGGIRKARPLLGEGRILVHNCDILSNADLKDFWAKGEGAAATLMVSERETTRYLLFDDDMNLKGWTNVKTGEVKCANAGHEYPAVKRAGGGYELIKDKHGPREVRHHRLLSASGRRDEGEGREGGRAATDGRGQAGDALGGGAVYPRAGSRRLMPRSRWQS